MAEPLRIAILTISDGVVAGTRADTSGDVIEQWVVARGAQLIARDVAADDTSAIVRSLLSRIDGGAVDVVLTTGGTGLTERDVTPEATRAVITRHAPGIAERIRQVGAQSTPYAALSRGIAGVRARTLVVNLPGSTGGVRDGLRVLDDIVDHAVQLLRGVDTQQHERIPR